MSAMCFKVLYRVLFHLSVEYMCSNILYTIYTYYITTTNFTNPSKLTCGALNPIRSPFAAQRGLQKHRLPRLIGRHRQRALLMWTWRTCTVSAVEGHGKFEGDLYIYIYMYMILCIYIYIYMYIYYIINVSKDIKIPPISWWFLPPIEKGKNEWWCTIALRTITETRSVVNRTQYPAPEWRLTRQGPKHLKPPRSTSAMTMTGLVRKLDPTHAMSCLFKWPKNGSFNHCNREMHVRFPVQNRWSFRFEQMLIRSKMWTFVKDERNQSLIIVRRHCKKWGTQNSAVAGFFAAFKAGRIGRRGHDW